MLFFFKIFRNHNLVCSFKYTLSLEIQDVMVLFHDKLLLIDFIQIDLYKYVMLLLALLRFD